MFFWKERMPNPAFLAEIQPKIYGENIELVDILSELGTRPWISFAHARMLTIGSQAQKWVRISMGNFTVRQKTGTQSKGKCLWLTVRQLKKYKLQ